MFDILLYKQQKKSGYITLEKTSDNSHVGLTYKEPGTEPTQYIFAVDSFDSKIAELQAQIDSVQQFKEDSRSAPTTANPTIVHSPEEPQSTGLLATIKAYFTK